MEEGVAEPEVRGRRCARSGHAVGRFNPEVVDGLGNRPEDETDPDPRLKEHRKPREAAELRLVVVPAELDMAESAEGKVEREDQKDGRRDQVEPPEVGDDRVLGGFGYRTQALRAKGAPGDEGQRQPAGDPKDGRELFPRLPHRRKRYPEPQGRLPVLVVPTEAIGSERWRLRRGGARALKRSIEAPAAVMRGLHRRDFGKCRLPGL